MSASAGTDRAREGWEERFLAALAKHGNIRQACKLAGVGRTTAYRRRDADPEFKARWERRVDDFADRLEAEATRRAVTGWEEPVFYKGEQVGSVRKYSDRMLELMLKAIRPHKFRESLADAIAGKTAAEMASKIRAALSTAEATVPSPPETGQPPGP